MSARPTVHEIQPTADIRGACYIEGGSEHTARFVLRGPNKEIVASCISASVLASWAFARGAETVHHSYLETKP